MPKWFSTTVESQPPPTITVGRTSSGWAGARSSHAGCVVPS